MVARDHVDNEQCQIYAATIGFRTATAIVHYKTSTRLALLDSLGSKSLLSLVSIVKVRVL